MPALLLGGPDGLRDDPSMRWEDTSIPLDVVGTAPDVEDATDPVVVVDADALAAAGIAVPPDSVWAVGPGAAEALEAVAATTPGSAVDDVRRRAGAPPRRGPAVGDRRPRGRVLRAAPGPRPPRRGAGRGDRRARASDVDRSAAGARDVRP